jgi:tryptophanyl-tRNA synthetase
VPEVVELSWLLGTLTPMGLLERAHSYKDKTAKGISPNFGLFAYPVLMAPTSCSTTRSACRSAATRSSTWR